MKEPESAVPKSPKDLEIEQLRKNIDEERRKRSAIIDETKRQRRRIAYKQAEQQAIARLVAMEPPNKKTKNIGYLKRLKEKLEFRIATEASSLGAEKDLVRKISEVDEELREALKGFRMRKKAELIEKDIEESRKKLEEQEKLIGEQDKKLDDLYSHLRKLTGMSRKPLGAGGHRERRPMQEPQPMEVSLADIAVIKDKKGADKEDEKD